jgi:hypothetical protein
MDMDETNRLLLKLFQSVPKNCVTSLGYQLYSQAFQSQNQHFFESVFMHIHSYLFEQYYVSGIIMNSQKKNILILYTLNCNL